MKTPSLARVLFLICAMACCGRIAAGATLQAKVTEVSSGNTLIVSNINRPLKVRLKGIAPPEVGQPFSDAAREHLKLLVFDKAVFVEYTNLSSGYLEAKVTLKGIDVASQMLRDGVAWYDHANDYALSDADRSLYAQCEEAARNEKRGLWSDPKPVAPWEFRRAQQQQLTKIETTTAPTVRPTASMKPKRQSAGSFSNADMFGNIFGGASSAGPGDMRPVSENGSPDRWVKVDSAAEHFSISVPSNSLETSFTSRDEQGQPVALHMLVGGSVDAFFVFLSGKGPQVALTDAAVFDKTMQSIIGGMNQAASEHGESDRVLKIVSSRPVTISGAAGRDFKLQSQAFLGNARVFTRKIGDVQEVFVMFCLTRRGDEVSAGRFINSFKLQ